MLVSQAKIQEYTNLFHKKVMATPHTIKYVVTHVVKGNSDSEFSMSDFVGDNPREAQTTILKALYEKEIAEWTREKYGLPKEVNGVIYLSPVEMKSKLGTYRVDENHTKIFFNGREQLINKVVYLENLYDDTTCIGVQIFVKDTLKA